MRYQMMLGRTQSGAMPSLPSQRPASFVTRNFDICGHKRRAKVFSARLLAMIHHFIPSGTKTRSTTGTIHATMSKI
eukprot:6173158-Pleurochrysis_carterae.AAC.1